MIKVMNLTKYCFLVELYIVNFYGIRPFITNIFWHLCRYYVMCSIRNMILDFLKSLLKANIFSYEKFAIRVREKRRQIKLLNLKKLHLTNDKEI